MSFKKNRSLSFVKVFGLFAFSALALALVWKNSNLFHQTPAKASNWVDTELVASYERVMAAHLKKYDLLNLPIGTTSQTINSIVASTPNQQDQLEKIYLATCGDGTTTNRDALAGWRQCRMVIAISLISYYDLIKKSDMSTALAYSIVYDSDSMATLPTDTPYHGLKTPYTTLGDTSFAKNYLGDSVIGVFTWVGWIKSHGLIANTFCTNKETPFDPGKNCKTINLSDRYVNVSKRVIATLDDFRATRSDGGFRAWTSTGRFSAAKLSGDPTLIFRTGFESEEMVMRELGIAAAAPSPFPLAWVRSSDTYQHLGVLWNDANFNITPEMKLRFPLWLDVFKKSFFNPIAPIADIPRNSYNPTNIKTLWGITVPVVSSGSNSTFTTDLNSNITVAWRGEHLSDNLLTSIPPLYYIAKDLGYTAQAQELRTWLYAMLTKLEVSPPDWEPETANSAMAWGTSVPKTKFSIALRIFNYEFYGYALISKTPVSTFSSNAISSPPMEAYDEFVLGNYLQQGFWRTSRGYARRVPLNSSGEPDWLQAEAWSAPIMPNTLPPGSGPIQTLQWLALPPFPSSKMLLSIWRDDIGYTRECPIINNVIIYNSCTPFKAVINVSQLPGVGGSQQAQSDFVNGNTNKLVQSLWKNNVGYVRSIPIINNAYQWSCANNPPPAGIASCPWSTVNISTLLGSGNMEAQSGFSSTNYFYQTYWRGGYGYSRQVPLDANKSPIWACQNNPPPAGVTPCPWSGPILTPGFN